MKKYADFSQMNKRPSSTKYSPRKKNGWQTDREEGAETEDSLKIRGCIRMTPGTEIILTQPPLF